LAVLGGFALVGVAVTHGGTPTRVLARVRSPIAHADTTLAVDPTTTTATVAPTEPETPTTARRVVTPPKTTPTQPGDPPTDPPTDPPPTDPPTTTTEPPTTTTEPPTTTT
jgi:hypothetical protein